MARTWWFETLWAHFSPLRLRIFAVMLALVPFLFTGGEHKAATPPSAPISDWPYYGENAGGERYSPLTQINQSNVKGLRIAWIYHTGDVSRGENDIRKSSFESTPIMVDGTLYLSTPFSRVIALDPATGKEKWSYDPRLDLHASYADGLINRGVSTWLDTTRSAGDPCHRRIFIGTIDARLIALDAATGKPCADFGKNGQVDLKTGITGIDHLGQYEETSPPAVIDDLVIAGSGISDHDKADMASGVVRAFDARTGARRWSWNPIPPNNTPTPPRPGAKNVWFTGAGNAWAPISVDAGRDLVFVPTGSASPDYWGGFRQGDDKWANSVVALRAKTGKFVWGFQLVHHDLWDYDTAAQPLLASIRHNGQKISVVIQGNKTGMLYVLNRDTGKPVFPVVEKPVPQSHVPGEHTSPTQPFPVAPPPLVPQAISAANAWGMSPQERAACHERMAKLDSGSIFTPPSLRGIIAFPGNLGGINWSGGAFDPANQLYVSFVNSLAMEIHLVSRNRFSVLVDEARSGRFHAELGSQWGTPYALTRDTILSPGHLPCNPPPWGLLVAVNLSTGKIAWSVPLGTLQDFHPDLPPKRLGLPGLGGPIITASGLVFVAGSIGDDYLRAFDIHTGEELWEGRLPAGGQATPMTYSVNGKQFVVIAAGGHGKLGTKQGDSLVAFALP